MASFVAGLCEELDYTRITYAITVEIVIVQERMTELLAA